jgi:hypothetical protein
MLPVRRRRRPRAVTRATMLRFADDGGRVLVE